ncbi:MAG: hypothetical protein ABR564_09070 [Candidatus Dormibacteria bacterium]
MRLSHRGKLGRVLVAAGATMPLVVGTGAFMQSSPVSAQSTLTSATYAGRACAIQLSNITLLGTTLIPDQCLGDSGPVPSGGGVATGPSGPVNVAGLLAATVVNTSAGGANGVSNASTRVAGLGVLPPAALPAGLNLPPIAGALPVVGAPLLGSLLSAEVVAADTSVGCSGPTQGPLVGNPPGLAQASPSNTGAATLVQSVAVEGGSLTSQITGQPNQSLDLGIVSLTFNQQLYNASTNTATANALAVEFKLPGILTGKLTVGHAESSVTNCVFSKPANPGIPTTGSLAVPGDTTGVSGSAGLRTAVIPAGLAAIVATALVLGWRRRRPTAQADELQG